MHYVQIFKQFGPAYAWWLFPFECFNGELEKVNLNGHATGEMELTLLRDWTLKHRLEELLLSLPADATSKERNLVQRVVAAHGRTRGTLEGYIAGFSSENRVLKPNSAKKITNLRQLQDKNIYALLLQYAQATWSDLSIVDDFTIAPGS
ncbi:hypothetical protein C0992_011209, partial [Termitomyces sp. T32_za158]